MTTVPDRPALRELEQPLGFLPTRRFWRDPENVRLARLPFAIITFALIFIFSALLDPPWWVVWLFFPVMWVLSQGLLELYVRRAAARRRLVRAEHAEPLDEAASEPLEGP